MYPFRFPRRDGASPAPVRGGGQRPYFTASSRNASPLRAHAVTSSYNSALGSSNPAATARAFTTSAVARGAPSFSSSSSRVTPTVTHARAHSTLYSASYMGSSTPFRHHHVTRDTIAQLEKAPLTHSPPGRVNDHICIGAVKSLRWLSDRVFRERYLHRATMLLTVAAAAPAAGAVAAYVRMFLFKSQALSDTAPYVCDRFQYQKMQSASGDHAAKAPREEEEPQQRPGPWRGSGASRAGTARSSQWSGDGNAGDDYSDAVLSAALPKAATRAFSFPLSTGRLTKVISREAAYSDELRGLMSQAECHTIHAQILLNMADIYLTERVLVFFAQMLHFSIFFVLFTVYPRMGFRLMGYLAEESSVVWTQMANDCDLGKVQETHPIPRLAYTYWGLPLPQSMQTADIAAVAAATASGRCDKVDESLKGAANAAQVVESAGTHMDAHVGGATAANEPKPDPAAKAVPVPARQQDTAADAAGSAAAFKPELRDLVLLVRADEMVFRDMNHATADAIDDINKHKAGFIRRYVREKLIRL